MPRRLAWAVLGLAAALICSGLREDSVQAEDSPGQTDWANCSACHENVGANLPKLSELRPGGLGSLLEDSCLTCHKNSDLRVPQSSRIHKVRPVGAHLACTQCHVAAAHGKGSPPPRPVGDYNAEGCFECHRDVDAQRHMFAAHDPGGRLTCIGCHAPHRPLEAQMPEDILPAGVRASWGTGYDYYASNKGCLECHAPAALFSQLRGGFATLNTVNYHELHVLRGRALCIECHETHGSSQRAMLRGRLLDGTGFAFRESLSGGSCATNCHGVDHERWEYINNVW